MTSYRPGEVTSKLAFEKMVEEGRLSERRAQVLYLVNKYPKLSSAEYSRRMVQEFPNLPIRVCVESPHKRLPELEDLGYVKKGGIKICSDSGNEVFYWIPVIPED